MNKKLFYLVTHCDKKEQYEQNSNKMRNVVDKSFFNLNFQLSTSSDLHLHLQNCFTTPNKNLGGEGASDR
jgi:hypothetical protein